VVTVGRFTATALNLPEGLLMIAEYFVCRDHINQPWSWMTDVKDR
jgi:hypothetical protein